MNRAIEYTLLGIGALMLVGSIVFWLTIIFAPLGIVMWFTVKHLIPQWTPLHTFGVILALGLFSGAYILNCLIGNKSQS